MSPRLPLLLLGLVIACQGPEEYHRFTGSGRPPIGSGGSIVTGSGGATGGGGVSGSGGKAVTGSGGTTSGSGGKTGSGGSTVSGPCTPTKTLANPAQVQDLGTATACIEITGNIMGWQCSNMDGRTVTVNGTAAACGGALPAAISGSYFFEFSAGGVSYASFSTW